jgi:MinD-like ATPase involved in chromosome partitioning or flagellar assembly
LHKKNTEKLAIGSCIMQDEYGVSTFVPSKGRNPLRELEGRDFIKFINHVTQEMSCSELVLDCGTGLDAAIVSALELSTKVCHVSGRNKDRNRKDAYLRTVSHRLGQSELFEMIEVLNFYDEPAPDSEELGKQVDKNVIIIDEDPASFTELNGHRFISLDKNFGLGIRQIADRLAIHEG